MPNLRSQMVPMISTEFFREHFFAFREKKKVSNRETKTQQNWSYFFQHIRYYNPNGWTPAVTKEEDHSTPPVS